MNRFANDNFNDQEPLLFIPNDPRIPASQIKRTRSYSFNSSLNNKFPQSFNSLRSRRTDDENENYHLTKIDLLSDIANIKTEIHLLRHKLTKMYDEYKEYRTNIQMQNYDFSRRDIFDAQNGQDQSLSQLYQNCGKLQNEIDTIQKRKNLILLSNEFTQVREQERYMTMLSYQIEEQIQLQANLTEELHYLECQGDDFISDDELNELFDSNPLLLALEEQLYKQNEMLYEAKDRYNQMIETHAIEKQNFQETALGLPIPKVPTFRNNQSPRQKYNSRQICDESFSSTSVPNLSEIEDSEISNSSYSRHRHHNHHESIYFSSRIHRSSPKISVGLFSKRISENEIEWLFSQYGKIKNCTIERKSRKKPARYYAIIQFDSSKDAQKAINKANHKRYKETILSVRWWTHDFEVDSTHTGTESYSDLSTSRNNKQSLVVATSFIHESPHKKFVNNDDNSLISHSPRRSIASQTFSQIKKDDDENNQHSESVQQDEVHKSSKEESNDEINQHSESVQQDEVNKSSKDESNDGINISNNSQLTFISKSNNFLTESASEIKPIQSQNKVEHVDNEVNDEIPSITQDNRFTIDDVVNSAAKTSATNRNGSSTTNEHHSNSINNDEKSNHDSQNRDSDIVLDNESALNDAKSDPKDKKSALNSEKSEQIDIIIESNSQKDNIKSDQHDVPDVNIDEVQEREIEIESNSRNNEMKSESNRKDDQSESNSQTGNNPTRLISLLGEKLQPLTNDSANLSEPKDLVNESGNPITASTDITSRAIAEVNDDQKAIGESPEDDKIVPHKPVNTPLTPSDSPRKYKQFTFPNSTSLIKEKENELSQSVNDLNPHKEDNLNTNQIEQVFSVISNTNNNEQAKVIVNEENDKKPSENESGIQLHLDINTPCQKRFVSDYSSDDQDMVQIEVPETKVNENDTNEPTKINDDNLNDEAPENSTKIGEFSNTFDTTNEHNQGKEETVQERKDGVEQLTERISQNEQIDPVESKDEAMINDLLDEVPIMSDIANTSSNSERKVNKADILKTLNPVQSTPTSPLVASSNRRFNLFGQMLAPLPPKINPDNRDKEKIVETKQIG